MIQINNGFKEYYYIDSEYKVYNSKIKRHLKIDSGGCVKLLRQNETVCHISYNKLLKLVFGPTFVLNDVISLPNEQWKQLNDSFYMCSDKGRIKSNFSLNSKILTTDKSTGYERLKIDIGYGIKNYYIHKLVAMCFLEPPKEPFMEIHHLNNDKLCNFSSNLVFLNREEHLKLHQQLKKENLNNEQKKNTNG